MAKKRILVICDYFLPGFKGGGGMRSAINLVDRFHDEFEFFVITRNHDGRTDLTPFSDVATGEWNEGIGGGKVFYLSPEMVNPKTICRLAREIGPDAVFLNSVFSTPCVSYLWGRRRKLAPDAPVVLAPCGELTVASMALKSAKKKLFLNAARLLGLHKEIIWKATTEIEVKEIRNAIGENTFVMTAPDLPPKTIVPLYERSMKPQKKPGEVRFACVARIVRIKNIDFILKRLASAKGNVVFDLLGPVEDDGYWNECKELIDLLPGNVTLNYLGAVSYEQTLNHLLNVHFFVLPSRSENFGYVFLEALAAGCPLLISDRTIWNDVQDHNAGWAVSLEDESAWEKQIAACVSMVESEYLEMSANARRYACNWLADTKFEEATRKILVHASSN